MIIDQKLLDELTAEAQASPRLRMNRDLRNSPSDQSQRMLNAIEPGSVLPIHRHRKSSETVVILRGHLRETFYDPNGQLTAAFDLIPGAGPEDRHGHPGVQGRGIRADGAGGYPFCLMRMGRDY